MSSCLDKLVRLGEVLLVATLALPVLTFAASAQNTIEITGPEGVPVTGGRMVPMGPDFTISFSFEQNTAATVYKNGVFIYGGGGGGDNYDVLIDTSLHSNQAVDRYQIFNGANEGGPYTSPHVGLNFSETENIWAFNQAASFKNALAILSNGPFTPGSPLQFNVSITDEMLQTGDERFPLRPDFFNISVARLGGSLDDGSKLAETPVSRSVQYQLEAGDQPLTLFTLEPGIYELRLQLNDGLIYDKEQFEIVPDVSENIADSERTFPVLLNYGFERKVNLPAGNQYRLGDELKIEMEWIKTDPEAPDPPNYFSPNIRFEIVFPGFSNDACLHGERDLPNRTGIQAMLEPNGTNSFSISLDTSEMPVGMHQIVFLGDNDRGAAATYEEPLDQVVSFEILAPVSQSLLAYNKSGDQEQGYYYNVSLANPLPPGVSDVSVQIVRPANQTAGGAILPERIISSQSLHEGSQVSMPSSYSYLGSELRLIGRYYCGHEAICETILDSVLIDPEDQTIPDEVKDRIRFEPPQLRQPWPKMSSDPIRICGAEPDETVDYQPPPFLALEAASYPREPIAGLPVSTAFRIQNTSPHDAAGVVVELNLVDSGSQKNPVDLQHIGELCAPKASGEYECIIGDMSPGAIADLEFSSEMPMTGALIWTADLNSAGDLGGLIEQGGVIGEAWPPNIIDVVVINKQDLVQDDVPSHPYPRPENDRRGDTRYLLVVGHNLPKTATERVVIKDTPSINYNFLAFPDTENSFYQDWFTKGWLRFYDIEDAASARVRAADDRYDSILVRADLLPGVMPGNQELVLDETSGHWSLTFGDLSAQFSFVRLHENDGIDLLTNAYAPERIYLGLQPNIALPVQEIPMSLSTQVNGSQGEEISMIARRSESGDGTLYVAGPIDLHAAGKSPAFTGGTAVAINGLGSADVQLNARIDENFVFEKFQLPLDTDIASVKLLQSPADATTNWLWTDALRRASICHPAVTVSDWSQLTVQESEEIWNLMLVGTYHFTSESVLFGHHAASLLMRDMFVSVTNTRLNRLTAIQNDPIQLRGFIKYLHPRTHLSDQPILRMPIEDFNGTKTTLRYAILNSPEWLAHYYGTSEEAIEAWQIRVTREALGQVIEAGWNSINLALEAGDCEVEDLIRITGFGFEPIAARVKSHLVAPVRAISGDGVVSTVWHSDTAARFWVDQIAPLEAAVREQQRRANIDTDISLLVGTLVFLPLSVAESASLTIASFAIDLLNLGLSTTHELNQKFASDAELAFSSGATVTLGDARFEAAQKKAKSWTSTSFGIGTSLTGAIIGGFDALPKIAKLHRVARGHHVVRRMSTAAEFRAMSTADVRDYGAFLMHSRMRLQRAGFSELTQTQRRSINLANDYAEISRQTRRLPEPDLPPAAVPDPSAPTNLIRFDPDAQTGLGTVRTPRGKRIETPSQGGDVPNSLAARVPESTVIRPRPAVDIEQELPLGVRLGEGSTSEVFAHANDPENLGVRITYAKENSPAALADEFGDRMVRTRVKSEHVRAVEIKETLEFPGGVFQGRDVSRVTIVERVHETAQQTIARQGGRMTTAQMLAFDGAIRDMNRQGLAWLDNKWDNFAFVPSPLGGGRVQIVIMDPGGIVLLKKNGGLSAAEMARQVQLKINGDYATQHPRYSHIRGGKERNAIRRDGVLDFSEHFDFAAMGITGKEQIMFNPRSGRDFEYVAPIIEAPE